VPTSRAVRLARKSMLRFLLSPAATRNLTAEP
jgi:hypothetical protein